MFDRTLKRVAVIQPLPGIGDMIWHLPHIRAVAQWIGQPVTLVAKPRSAADELFASEQTIEDVLWLDRNPERRRGGHDGVGGLLRLIASLRARRFEAAVLMHHSRTLAAAMFAARIPHRYGYGYRLDRLFLNRPPYLPPETFPLHPHEQASEWVKAARIPLEQTEPSLSISEARRTAARQRLGIGAAPFVVFGIGTSEPYKQWGLDRYVELGSTLLDAGCPHIVLAAGNAEIELANAIRQRAGDRTSIAIGWKLGELAALLAEAAYYVGNDTGVMNLAAAAGIRTYGLFGAVSPFHHSRAIVPILPPDGISDKATGMARITTAAVLEAMRADHSRFV